MIKWLESLEILYLWLLWCPYPGWFQVTGAKEDVNGATAKFLIKKKSTKMDVDEVADDN